MINDTKNKSIEQKKIANDTLLLDSTFCKNELELINSPSFIKVFEQILFQAEIPDINQEYILDIIEKILFKNKSQLTEKERLDFLHIINHKNLLEKAIKYYDIYKYTNNLEKNKISVYSIKRKLINESVIKRVLSIIELKKSK
ncbi:hypothetical protein HOG21_07880 [bacterium]|nr:hypothetical protein [bacterium]